MAEALFTLVGVVLGASIPTFFGFFQTRRAERAASIAKAESQLTQRWERSLSTAYELQADFAGLLAGSKHHYLNPRSGPFDPLFGEAWEQNETTYQQRVALIPDQSYREALELVCEGLSYHAGLVAKAGYEQNDEAAAHKLAKLGLDVTSSWIRRDDIDAGSAERLAALRSALQHMNEEYEVEEQLQAELNRDRKDRNRSK
jgi:hypothetical protein